MTDFSGGLEGLFFDLMLHLFEVNFFDMVTFQGAICFISLSIGFVRALNVMILSFGMFFLFHFFIVQLRRKLI